MTVYVAEIAGRAIFAFDAPDADAAKARLSDREYLGDLYVLQSDGHSLWDGRTAIEMREAVAEEAEVWADEHESIPCVPHPCRRSSEIRRSGRLR